MKFITEDNIAALYAAFVYFPPFDNYKFPPPSKVEFVVTSSVELYGEYQPCESGDPHIITISTGKCSHLDTVVKTLMHEMIHMALYLEQPKGDYHSHKGRFSKLQKQVARIYGFDPKEL